MLFHFPLYLQVIMSTRGLHEMKLALGLARQAASPFHLVTLQCRHVADIFGLNTGTVQA